MEESPYSYKRPPRDPGSETEITVVRTEDGGRRYPLFYGYRVPHDFGLPNEMNDGMHEYPERGLLWPGETARALIGLLVPERNKGKLYAGMPFTMHEDCLIARGRIVGVANPMLERNVP